jgi:hypothetical protein
MGRSLWVRAKLIAMQLSKRTGSSGRMGVTAYEQFDVVMICQLTLDNYRPPAQKLSGPYNSHPATSLTTFDSAI